MALPNKEGQYVVQANRQNVDGKVFLLTGPSQNSLSAEMALTLAKEGSPAMIILLGRSRERAAPVLESISACNSTVKAVFVECDLSRHESVRAAVSTVKGLTDKIHVVINSAATMANPQYEESSEHIEMQFAVGYVGHFLLTCSLMKEILAAGDGARIVNLISMGYVHSEVRYNDINFENGKSYNEWAAYGQSKTACMLFTLGLADRLSARHVQAYSVYPGYAHTELQRYMTAESAARAYKLGDERISAGLAPPFERDEWRSKQEAIYGVLTAALSPSLTAFSGSVIVKGEVYKGPLASYATDKNEAVKLWKFTEDLLGEKFEI